MLRLQQVIDALGQLVPGSFQQSDTIYTAPWAQGGRISDLYEPDGCKHGLEIRLWMLLSGAKRAPISL